jgi:3-hydroxyisobutyrate dehydrogenase-like beta-hydroxyacid dehydrogenase
MGARPVVAIVSPGEMGHAIGRVLTGHSLRVITSLDGRSERTVGLARAAGLEDVGSLERAIDEADLVLSVLPSAAAPGLAQAVAGRLAGRRRPLTFVECNALAPQTVRELTGLVAAAGGGVVDVGIVGSPPTAAASPRFYAAGPHLDPFLALGDHGLDVRPLGAEIGRASGLKMCYAALTKGLSALGAELLLAAAYLDLLEPLLAEFAASQPAALAWLERGVPGMPSKARRWVSEMEEIAATLGYLGLSPGYHQAATDLYRWVGETRLGHVPPETRDARVGLRDVITELAAAHRQHIGNVANRAGDEAGA